MTTTTASINTTPRRPIRRRSAAAALFAAAVAVSMGACADESAHPPKNDVDSGWTCTTEGGVARTAGTITNHSSKTSFYQLDIEFRVDGQVVDERGASIDGVEPGETTRVEVISDDAHGDVTCHIADVTRFKA